MQLVGAVTATARRWHVDELPSARYLRAEDEIVEVQAVYIADSIITVRRGIEGSTAASHAAGTALEAPAFGVGGDVEAPLVLTSTAGQEAAGTAPLEIVDSEATTRLRVILDADGAPSDPLPAVLMLFPGGIGEGFSNETSGLSVQEPAGGFSQAAIQAVDSTSVPYFTVAATGPLSLKGVVANARPFNIQGAAAQSVDLMRVRDSGGTVLMRLNKDGYIFVQKTSAPADADISANQVALWFDATNGAAKLKIKGKSANGTVVQGEVPLT